MEYVYADASYEERTGIDAQTAGEELQRIKQEHGQLTPATVVDESRPEEAPLHPVFEWRDPVAAEQWREHQAASLIKRVRVVPAPMHDEPSAPRVTRAAAVPPPDVQLDPHDPLVWQLDQAAAAVLKAQDQVRELQRKAQARFDRRRQIQATVALTDLEGADQLLEDARETLVASRLPSQWPAPASV